MPEQKKPIWITIPDKKDNQKKTLKKADLPVDRVEKKAFWAAGFVAMIVFSVMIFAPSQMAGLMKAQLFDGDFQFVPDFEDQQAENGDLFGGEDEVIEEAEEAEAVVPTDNVVEAELEPVSIQIDPIVEEAEAAEEASSEAESSEQPEGEATEEDLVSEPVTEQSPVETEASTDLEALVKQLSEEVNALKQEGIEKNEQIAALNAQAQNNGSLFGSAEEFGLENPTIPDFTNTVTTPTSNNSSAVYRYNTHTITVNPRDVLAQNQELQAGIQSQIQASNLQANLPNYSQQNYNPVLSNVNAQPATGPAESLMFTLLVASMAVLGFGIYRSVRV